MMPDTAIPADGGTMNPSVDVAGPSPVAIEACRAMLRGRPEFAELAREVWRETRWDVLENCGRLAGVAVTVQGEYRQHRRRFDDLTAGEFAMVGRCAGLLVNRGEESPATMAELRRLRLLAYL